MYMLKPLIALLLAMLMAACAPSQTSRSTGQTLDDAAITARVKTEVAKASGITDAAMINVDTYRGVVSLAGFVDSEQQRNTAAKAAMEVPGVSRVVNNLQLKKRP
ncbi:BON domain-containing protein [Noviherbaspirillum sp. CPCC 100848]|uniref:BON domain-containing protein n=1 Tax=Noviherbaspirillum album TaxID=3080276 RepID=A0ABU6JHP9_9BURK|nr:BON domain-containing protein [Noviherbaspirillum sp. CPCC 100848]MEC4723184.1 BON domain-containing protein [Noviherbaspirillum sp. CPCC 100848]